MNEDNRSGQASEKSSRKGAIIAVAALVIILVAGLAAYRALGADGPDRSAADNTAAASEAEDATKAQADSDASADAQVASTAQAEAAAQEDAAPTLADLNSVVEDEMQNAYDLVGIADGRPLVVNFWATWCPYCIQEMGDFQAVYDIYGDEVSFAMLDAVDGTRETVEKGSAYIQENEFTFPVYYDVKSNAVYDFGISAYPTTVIFDADGNVIHAQSGAMDAAYLTRILESLV